MIASTPVNIEKTLVFCKTDDDIYNAFNAKGAAGTTAGSLCAADFNQSINVNQFGKTQDRVRIIAKRKSVYSENFFDGYIKGCGSWQVTGYIKKNSQWYKAEVIRIPSKYGLFAKGRGLFETDILKNKTVLLIGCGSGGAPVALGLAQLGIGIIILVDHDRLEVGNITRNPAGIKDIGRYKISVMKEMILNINPYTKVITCNEKVTQKNQDKIAGLIAQSDIVINAADDPKCRIIINKHCVEQGKPLIMGGCFRRAYGGQVFYIRPGHTPCYQCFLNNVPGVAEDYEISNQQQADSISYSDRQIPVEPGLANDIAPISQKIVKLTLTEIMRNEETTLKTLRDDFKAFWYLWLNRREPDTAYENLAPMGFGLDMSIMRWYGLPMPKDPACSCCGDITNRTEDGKKIAISEKDMDIFR